MKQCNQRLKYAALVSPNVSEYRQSDSTDYIEPVRINEIEVRCLGPSGHDGAHRFSVRDEIVEVQFP